MKHKVFTCILCPNGCEIEVDYEGTELIHFEGNRCARGREYVAGELACPMRSIASSVLVEGGELPLVSVRLTRPIPRSRIFDVMGEIRRASVTAPVKAGTVLLHDVCGTFADVIATKTVEAKSSNHAGNA